MLPSAHDLLYLIAAADAANITKAASKMGISQPSLSLAIQRLERDLETQLLERNTKGVRLTRAGKILVQSSRELTEQWAKIRAQVSMAHTEVAGVVTVGCHPAVAAYTLPRFIPGLLRQYPQLEIKLQHDLSRRITQDVIDGSIDIGLVINPVRYPDLVMHEISKDEVGFWQAPHLDARLERTCIADPDLLQTQSLLRKVQKRGEKFQRFITSSQLEVIASLTASGAGIGILPKRVAEAFAGGKIKAVSQLPTFSDSLFLIYRSERKNLEVLKVVVNAIKVLKED